MAQCLTSLSFSLYRVLPTNEEKHTGFFRSAHPRLATSERVTKNLRGKEKTTVVDLVPADIVNVVLQLYFIVCTL